MDDVSEPRSSRGPWRIIAKQGANAPDSFELANSDMSLTRWRTKSRPNEPLEKERIQCKKWIDEGESEVPPTTPLRAEIAPTVLDSPPSPDKEMAEDKKRGECAKEESPPKKVKGDHAKNAEAMRPTDDEVAVYGGGLGPGGGGAGACGWKALAFGLAEMNKRPGEDIEERIEELAEALRLQSINHLVRRETDWQKCWFPSAESIPTTESGAVAKDVSTFLRDVLPRPGRYICELGLAALAQINRKHVVIFKCFRSGWKRIAVFSPTTKGKRQIIALCHTQQHYLCIARGDRPRPQIWAEPAAERYIQKGVLNPEKVVLRVRGSGGPLCCAPQKPKSSVEHRLRSGSTLIGSVRSCGRQDDQEIRPLLGPSFEPEDIQVSTVKKKGNIDDSNAAQSSRKRAKHWKLVFSCELCDLRPRMTVPKKLANNVQRHMRTHAAEVARRREQNNSWMVHQDGSLGLVASC